MAHINEENVSKLIPTLGDEKIGTYLRKFFINFVITYPYLAINFETNIKISFCFVLDMIAATSVLQIRASEIRQSQINWQSYLQ